jgi:hypothetical protein
VTEALIYFALWASGFGGGWLVCSTINLRRLDRALQRHQRDQIRKVAEHLGTLPVIPGEWRFPVKK